MKTAIAAALLLAMFAPSGLFAADSSPVNEFPAIPQPQGFLDKEPASDTATLRAEAEKGNAVAQYHLGIMYANGQEVEKNVMEAIRFLRLAAEQGHLDAQFNLGRTYMSGNYIEEALYWYAKAAAAGHRASQNNIGRLYALGKGVPQDYVQAYKWWLLSARQGDQIAEKNLIKLKAKMNATQIAEADRLVEEWLKSVGEK